MNDFVTITYLNELLLTLSNLLPFEIVF
uniref:Uncharacterized protein n=1 Tax=Anguilla anguilla TaxID=7936 RepID=A0A0E9Q475_ANGAN